MFRMMSETIYPLFRGIPRTYATSMADDFTSRPTGNSGSRIACGVIR